MDVSFGNPAHGVYLTQNEMAGYGCSSLNLGSLARVLISCMHIHGREPSLLLTKATSRACSRVFLLLIGSIPVRASFAFTADLQGIFLNWMV